MSSFRLSVPYLTYQLNYKYISTVLCENIGKVEMDCKGKCYLNKQLKEAAKDQSSNSEFILTVISFEEIPEGNTFSFLSCFLIEESFFYDTWNDRLYNTALDNSSPPPKV